MKKSVFIGLFWLLAMSGTAWATSYGVLVGLNQYSSSYIESSSWLDGCVPDANHVYTNAIQRGDWSAATVTRLLNSAGSRTAIRRAITNYAAVAVSGDTFLYFHSSHGGNDDWPYSKSVYLCAYDADYSDTLLASDLAKFATGVKVIVIVDACHSGGLFQSSLKGTRVLTSTGGTWDLAGRVTAIMEADRATKLARGVKGMEKLIAPSGIGWITAADYDQYSWDDTDGGEFTTAMLNGWSNGTCDNATYGNQDGYADFYELWNYAKDIAIGYPDETDPDDGTSYASDVMAYNVTVLQNTMAGIAGDGPVADQPPVIALNPAGTNKSVAFGVPLSFTVTATDGDGLAVSLTATGLPSGATAPSNSGTGTASTTFNWTPAEAQIGSYNLSFSATDKDGTTVQGVRITVTDGSTTADLLISEYIEGSSSEKYIEIFNGTGTDVNLSDYKLQLYGNGASTPGNDITLSGTLADGAVKVYRNTSALLYSCDANAAVNFNGDDAVALYKISSASHVDIIGCIGEDPGTAWTDGALSTLNQTLVRKSTVAGGVTVNPGSGFPSLSTEWDTYAQNTVSYLGSHTFGGGGATTSAPAFNAIGGQSAVVGVATSFTVSATGTPTPTLALQSQTASSGYSFTAGTGQLSYTAPVADLGARSFTFTASNAAGVATQTVSVTVSEAPVLIPTVSVVNLLSTSFTVNWTATTGGSTYQVQVATDAVFAADSGGSLMENAGFEAGDNTGWDKFETEYAVVSTDPQEGTYHAACTATGTRDLMQAVDITGDGVTAYEVSFYYKKPLSNGNARIWATWATGGQVSGDSLQPTTYLPAAANWTEVTYSVVPSNGLNTLNFEVRTYSGASVSWDNFYVGLPGGARAVAPRAIAVDQTVAALTYGVTGLTPATPYFVRVRATGGLWSDTVSATTTAGGGTPTPPPQPICDVVSPTNGAPMGMQIATQAGVTYRLQYTTNLMQQSEEDWVVADEEPGDGGNVTLQDADCSGVMRYYRIVKP